MKWVLQLYFFKLQNLVGHLKSIWVGRFAHMGVMTMSDMITGIQQTLNDIDRQALKGDWHLKFEVMTLLIASIEMIMNELRNETKPKQKTIKKTNYIPRYKDVKRVVNIANNNNAIRKGVSGAERLQQQKNRLQAKGSSGATLGTISTV